MCQYGIKTASDRIVLLGFLLGYELFLIWLIDITLRNVGLTDIGFAAGDIGFTGLYLFASCSSCSISISAA